MYLYHYFDKTVGAFVSLSDLSIDEASDVLRTIRQIKPNTQSATRYVGYEKNRQRCENIIRTEFIKIGGVVKRKSPHYMVVEHSPWL